MSRPSMSAYVLSFLDSMRQRTCFLGHWRTLTDIGGLGRTLADSDGQGRTLVDLDGHWRTRTDSCCKGEACLPRSHNKGEPLSTYVLSFFGFYKTTDVFVGSLADIDGH